MILARARDAEALRSSLDARAKAQKAKRDRDHPGRPRALRKKKQVVTGDADTLDACVAWFNLVGRIVESIAGPLIVRPP